MVLQRRTVLRGLLALAACPLCPQGAIASEGVHWTYEGAHGPDHWGALEPGNAACATGAQQSPIDIAGTVRAALPPLEVGWGPPGGTIVNNGHTVQVDVPAGGVLTRGGEVFDLLQYHLHAPSEHLVEGRRFAMELHFVHGNPRTGDLAVLGVFLDAGARNADFARLAAAFPAVAGGTAPADGIDPRNLLPPSLAYWTYEGSLTTPPCTEIVTWLVARAPLEADAADIARFTSLYPGNARPVLPPNRRFILASD